MRFDKNQSAFPSDFCRDVWWWAVGLVPPEVSLTEDVRGKSGPRVIEGCYQWHDYFNALCEDMYNNESEYTPASPRQYRDILERVAAGGELRGDNIVWPGGEWAAFREKLNRSKAYISAGVTVNRCLEALERVGLTCASADGVTVFAHTAYPKIFHAMAVMERSPNVRDTPVRHHFAHCEFRQLYKSYSPNYDELMRRASDESLYIAGAIHEFLKARKIPRYIHFGIMKYKYKSVRVLDYNLYGSEYPTLRINIGGFRINPFKSDLDLIFKRIEEKIASIDEN